MRHTALIVDDNPAQLYANSKVLSSSGFTIIEAVTGEEAVKRSSEKPDIIILDVNLPDLNGYEVCRIIKDNPYTVKIPIIFISAHFTDIPSQVQGIEVGADLYLTAPVDPRVLSASVNSMLRIRHAEEKIYKAAMQWQTTFDAMKDGICLLNVLGQVEQCNAAFRDIVRLKNESLLNQYFDVLLPVFENFNADFFLYHYKSKTAYTENIQINGRIYKVYLNPIIDDRDKFTGTVFVLTDNTDLRKTFMELERSNKELEQFAYIVSHDLREPLRMISRYSELIVKRFKEKVGTEAEEFVSFISEGTNRMQKLITDLLAYSRINIRERTFEKIDLNEIVADVLDSLRYIIEEKKADIKVQQFPSVYGDEVILNQLFQNLLVNALKFSRDNDIHISIECEDSGDDWLFSVHDNGIGIDQKFHERIFVIFQRLHARDKYPGTGIGLAVCKKIVEQLGGRIYVKSTPGAGSSFFFTLPKN